MQTLKAKKQGFHFFANFRKLKKQGFDFLQTLKAKKQRYNFFANVRKLRKWIVFFASFKKMKKQGFYFLQTVKAKKQGFYFLQTLKAKKQGFLFLQTLKAKKHRGGKKRADNCGQSRPATRGNSGHALDADNHWRAPHESGQNCSHRHRNHHLPSAQYLLIFIHQTTLVSTKNQKLTLHFLATIV